MWKKWIPRLVIFCGLLASGFAFLLSNLEYGSNSRSIASESAQEINVEW